MHVDYIDFISRIPFVDHLAINKNTDAFLHTLVSECKDPTNAGGVIPLKPEILLPLSGGRAFLELTTYKYDAWGSERYNQRAKAQRNDIYIALKIQPQDCHVTTVLMAAVRNPTFTITPDQLDALAMGIRRTMASINHDYWNMTQYGYLPYNGSGVREDFDNNRPWDLCKDLCHFCRKTFVNGNEYIVCVYRAVDGINLVDDRMMSKRRFIIFDQPLARRFYYQGWNNYKSVYWTTPLNNSLVDTLPAIEASVSKNITLADGAGSFDWAMGMNDRLRDLCIKGAKSQVVTSKIRGSYTNLWDIPTQKTVVREGIRI